ncbi:YkgJ family cysteine cluster protein [Ancylothrix sp. C2]|uniref:YkgJ family cysteine cluster protein n=1 Tax=Ancylothrix sp. D3o TaxID=2953691 RepID=UPI0021BB9FDA|nr:YkgJ family cysteine cluster protein [Ancylothrix sp. D3o]MCT7952718.1 YkgJ family cysteine cluster protein [Ancylothrix sp. D3o]
MNQAQQKLLDLEQRIEVRVQDIRASRDWWPCRRGCDQCCRQLAQPPELSLQEWARIDEAVAALSATVRAEVVQKIEQLLVQIAKNIVGSHVVCPYLDENEGACRIYDARPIACRTYGFFVARNGSDYCQIIEKEVFSRTDAATDIVWGNAESIHNEIERVCGKLIPFDAHYQRSNSL